MKRTSSESSSSPFHPRIDRPTPARRRPGGLPDRPRLHGYVRADGRCQGPQRLAARDRPWALAKSRDIVPVIGAPNRRQLTEALGALRVELTPDEITSIEAAVPASAVAGTRYGAQQIAMLDSEGDH